MIDAEEQARVEQAKSHTAYSTEHIEAYQKTGEISSKLSLDACLAVLHSENNWDRIFQPYADHERKWFHVYRRVADETNEIQLKMKEFEFKHWMGFCDEDVKELLDLYQKREKFDWKNASESDAKFMRELWDPFDYSCKGKQTWKKYWLKYHKRRSRKPLQALNGEFCSTDTDVLERLARLDEDNSIIDKMKILMGGSAGRVLITMQDRFAQNNPESKYGGAWVTLIFDESAEWPRGGVQGHCGTKDEIVRLIQDCIDHMPTLTKDSSIRIF